MILLQLFNVGISEFIGEDNSTDSQLQNALARLGASHVRESENVVPSERVEEVNRVVVEALVDGSARLVSALAPVLVANIDRVGLRRIEADLAKLGLENRLAWLVENVEVAVREELSGSLDTTWRKQYQRAALQLEQFSGVRVDTAVDGQPDRHLGFLDPEQLNRGASQIKLVENRRTLERRHRPYARRLRRSPARRT